MDGEDLGIVETGGDPITQPPAPNPQEEVGRLRGELAAERAGRLEAHRRALLAENAGRVVSELVQGDTVEALEASVERARAAHEAVRQATIVELSTVGHVGAGNGARGAAVDVESMSPMQKIAYGLRPSAES